MAAVDPWNDGWENIADREAVKAKSEAIETVGGHGSSSGSSTTSNSSSLVAPNTGPKILAKKVPAEEENRKIWEAANASTAFEVVPSASAPTKVVNFKPELKILKRAPPAAPAPKSVNTNSESPATLDRKEKERRYAEARERLFGPASSTASSESTTSVTTTPTAGMSRSSSSSGLPNKTGENGSGTTTPSRERGVGGARGGKKGGRGNNSGNNTPRSRSPGRAQRGNDPNRTSGIVGGITKVTENGWVYTGTGQPPRTSSPASTKPGGVDSRVSSPGIAAVSAGMMSMNLNTPGGYNTTNNSYTSISGMPGPWSMGNLGGGPGVIGQRPQGGFILSGQGYPSQQFIPQNQSYSMAQPPQFPQYSGPPASFNSQSQSYQQQQPQANNFSSYQTSGVPGTYNIPPQQHPTLQQHNMPPSHLNYQRNFAPNSNGPSPLSTTISPASRYEPTGGASRTVYLQDPNAFAPRPPPPQGNLLPGYGNNPVPLDGNGDSLGIIRTPRGPDMNMGRGFSGRGGRGGGFGAS